VAEIERTGQPKETFTVRAPADGVVLTRNAYASQMVKPEMELSTLADLGRVWIAAEVQEADLAGLRVGQVAMVEPGNLPGRRFSARIVSTAPQLDPRTRTLQVRLEAANASLELRPELFVNVEIRMARSARLTVPDNAVVDSGTSQVVYMVLGDGRFAPRRVTVGGHAEGRVEILAGLTRGERVVSNGAFLLDSESRLRSPAR
jgi:RND family efflux transporter MFP subunit